MNCVMEDVKQDLLTVIKLFICFYFSEPVITVCYYYYAGMYTTLPCNVRVPFHIMITK